MRILGIIFLVIGLPFLVAGLVWLEFISDYWNQWEMLIGPMVFCFMGLVFTLIGGGVLFAQRRQRLKRELLKQTGRKIQATITYIGLNQSIGINNRHPQIIECKAIVSGKETTFKSTNIYGNHQLKIGDTLDVYMDFRNYANYWVEVPAS